VDNLFIQIMSLILSLVAFSYCMGWLFVNKALWFVCVPPLVYFLHIILFYSIVISGSLLGRTVLEMTGFISSNLWSSILRLHGIITMISFLIIAKQFLRVIKNGTMG